MKKMVIAVVVLIILAGGLLAKRAMAEDKTLKAGTLAPDFSAISQEDKAVHLSDYKGKWVVLYFYPKDQTSGCTIEAHNFQRDQAKYDAANAVVLGVSVDSVESHKTWCSKDTFSFKLLADPDHKVVDAYGVGLIPVMHWAKRKTFLIDPKGTIVKVWPDVSVGHHSDEVLAEIAAKK